jgi:hypothetical protein
MSSISCRRPRSVHMIPTLHNTKTNLLHSRSHALLP